MEPAISDSESKQQKRKQNGGVIIIPDKKKAATIILSRMKPGGAESQVEAKPEMQMDDKDASLQSIAEDIMHAFSTKSASDLMIALKAFCANCEDYEGE